jgi:ketosteroid isomerase-like protein
MTVRNDTERLLLELYAARVRGDLQAVSGTFASDATFHIAGASNASPTAITAVGVDEFRPLLAIMIKSFTLSEHRILSMVIDGAKAAVHWQARILSRITGTSVLTELVDMVEIRNGRIASYTELFVPL